MKPVVIATATMYKSLQDVRAQLAAATIQEAKKHGYPIVIVDESPDESTREHFRNLGAITFPAEKPGMGHSRRQVIREASNLAGPDGIVAWVEPEKHAFIPFLGMIAEVMESQSADFVSPRRKSLESYPLFQQHFEWLGNRAFQMLTGRDLDVWFGPRIFRPDIAPFFLAYQGEYGDKWDSLFVPVLRIIKAEKKVIEVKVDYTYPSEQATEEENNFLFFMRRIEQLTSLVESLEKECKALGLP